MGVLLHVVRDGSGQAGESLPGLSARERELLVGAVRLAEAMRLGLDPWSFSPSALPPAAREGARRAEAQLRRRSLSELRGPSLALTAASGALVLTCTLTLPSRVTRELRDAVRKVFDQLQLR